VTIASEESSDYNTLLCCRRWNKVDAGTDYEFQMLIFYNDHLCKMVVTTKLRYCTAAGYENLCYKPTERISRYWMPFPGSHQVAETPESDPALAIIQHALPLQVDSDSFGGTGGQLLNAFQLYVKRAVSSRRFCRRKPVKALKHAKKLAAFVFIF
jgi:hypothetical protein